MDLTADHLALGVLWYVVFVFSTTCHEAAHALAALKLGDQTAYKGGQVTLNPVPHIQREIFGMIVVPILTFLFNGWMLGWASAPYDPQWALRHPKRSALMSLAGPGSNLLLAILALLAIRVGMLAGVFYAPDSISGFAGLTAADGGPLAAALASALSIAFLLNLLLCLFNLMPLPPLDGSGALTLVMSDDLARRYQTMLFSQPALALIGLLVAWQLFAKIPLLGIALKVLYPELSYG